MGKGGNGSGSIWRRSDGRYGAALSYDFFDTTSGGTRRKRETTTKATWEEANEWLIAKQSQIRSGIVVSKDNPTLKAFLEGWLRDVIEPSRSWATHEKRKSFVKVHIVPVLGKVKLKDLNPRQIQSFYSGLQRRDPPLKITTIRDTHVTLKMALDQAVRWGEIARNPVDLVDPPKEKRQIDERDEKVRALTNAQAEHFFSETHGKRWHNYYVVAIRTGLRPGEALGLRWGDLDLDPDLGSLKVYRSLDTSSGVKFNPPKNEASKRRVVLHWEAKDAFLAQRSQVTDEGFKVGQRDLVFPSTRGTPMNNDNLLTRNLRPDLRSAGLPELTLHELRHTFASIWLHEWMVSPSIVQEMLGHDDITMTMKIYGHLFPGAQEDAIRALRKLYAEKSPESKNGRP